MPRFRKEALSKFIRTDCQRQLRLYLSRGDKDECLAEDMPPHQPPRPGLMYLAEMGEEWQAAKLHDLTQTFGSAAIIGIPRQTTEGQTAYSPIALGDALSHAFPGCFLVEATYTLNDAFESALEFAGYGICSTSNVHSLTYDKLRPDIIQVFAPGRFASYITPYGEILTIQIDDERLQLRVIDVKLTAEPSPSYFAEVAYYSMVLAGWLITHGFDDRFVVVPDGAIWSGSHDASNLTIQYDQLSRQGTTPSTLQLLDAMEGDLELLPFEVFAFRIRSFFQRDLPAVLGKPWRTLEWHVDSRCRGCEYVGYPWFDKEGNSTAQPDHCMPMAGASGHLSQVAFIPRGASAALRHAGVGDVASLALTPVAAPVFDTHQTLRATRTVVSSRALALQQDTTQIAPSSGTSAIMPRWADLHIYISCDFDLGSAITFAFGVKAFWLEPRPYGSTISTPRQHQSWQQTFIVPSRDIQSEQTELINFVNYINGILATASQRDPATTVQLYIWDSIEYDHLTRVIGRYLQAILNNQTIQRLAWLFPPEQLMPNPALVTRRSPLTIVRDVVRGLLAAPIPYYYNLLATARVYHEASQSAYFENLSVHPLFEDALSDLIPSERAHEIWSKSPPPRYWRDQMAIMVETVEKRLSALETITKRLETDLSTNLSQTAPQIGAISQPAQPSRLSTDGQLWYAYAKLNNALEELETHQVRAMPPHEREARFRSARLRRRLTGQDEQSILAHFGLQSVPFRRVYELRDASREVKLREGDFSFAISPEVQHGFLDKLLLTVTQGTALEPTDNSRFRTTMADVTQVAIRAIDRDKKWIVLDPNSRWPAILDDLETLGLASFANNAILDPVHHDFFTSKLVDALQAIGNPPIAGSNPLVRQATGQLTGRGARRTVHSPPADFLWDASAMHQAPVNRILGPVKTALQQAGLDLNTGQWIAWKAALTRRLQLIWGPPGTGKSQTARMVVLGAALEAHQQDKPIRILICTSTYTALDNVLLDTYRTIQALIQPPLLEVHRLRSYLHPAESYIPPSIDRDLNRRRPSPQIVALRAALTQPDKVILAGATPEQVHNLLTAKDQPARDELFDLILIDEASQMDVAHAILAISSLASGGSVILAGDPKQLPPIHQAEAPEKLDAMVGSIYSFCNEFHGVPQMMLETNYRSNSSIVGFALRAGYASALTSHSPDLTLNFINPLPSAQPANWPVSLHWTPEWSVLLDPNIPVSCFVYPDGRNSQWNEFEADVVSTLIGGLYDRLGNRLLNERDRHGHISQVSSVPYSPTEFWANAVGVVTPHRAQQGLVISRLQTVFANTATPASAMRDAVDTVERFQGQQRDVIIATFALGDKDAISQEDEFLMSLNRFNVMASRPRAKLIVLASDEIIEHLSSDIETLRASSLLKAFVRSYCNKSRPMTLGHLASGVVNQIIGQFRWHG